MKRALGVDDSNIAALMPHNVDAERLSWAQRVAKLETEMAMIYPAIRGEEKPDGSTRPGILRRLETMESAIGELTKATGGLSTTTKLGGGAAFIAWVVTQFGITDVLKHAVISALGGHP